MKFLFSIFTVFILINSINAKSLQFNNELLVDKTFYIEEESGYDTIVKFYLNDNKLRMFYVIFYNNKLEETMTLDAVLKDGKITYTVFDRPTKLEIEKITDNEITVKEYLNNSKEHKNVMILQFEKPKNFAQ